MARGEGKITLGEGEVAPAVGAAAPLGNNTECAVAARELPMPPQGEVGAPAGGTEMPADDVGVAVVDRAVGGLNEGG